MVRTTGNIVSLVVGAALGLGLMRLLEFGGGIPAGIFALIGASLGELLYKSFSSGEPEDNEKQHSEKTEEQEN